MELTIYTLDLQFRPEILRRLVDAAVCLYGHAGAPPATVYVHVGAASGRRRRGGYI